MIGKTTNKLLQDTEQRMTAKVPPQFKGAFDKVMRAGLTIIYDDKSRKMVLDQMAQKGDPAQIIGEAVAKLLGLMFAKSNNSMPLEAGVPAGTVLLCEAMDFAEQAGMLKVTPQTLETAMHAFSASFLQLMGVSPKKLSLLVQQKSAAKNPAQAAPANPAQPAHPTPPASPQPATPGGLVAQAQGAPA